MKTLMIAMVLALATSGALAADKMTRADKCEAKFGQQAGETTAQYEKRIQKARMTLLVAQPYIDSNMLWEDGADYERGNY